MQKPLSEIMRPENLDGFIGQNNLIGSKEKPGTLRSLINSGNIPSMIFWGPPASGKTTLAKIISKTIEAEFYQLSAVTDGKDKLKEIIKKADENDLFETKTILFLDEIHRWNKAQQDALLPEVESGRITLIGATTENPSFNINSALLSRARVFIFNELGEEEIYEGLERSLVYLKQNSNSDSTPPQNLKPKFLKKEVEALELLSNLANGDIRFAINSLEIAFGLDSNINPKTISNAVQKTLRHDKNGEEHYNLISAVHKSLRSSNPSAATYWVVRMLEAGDDPLYVARRLLRFASEDVGNASPTALLLANSVYETCQKLGMPECNTAIIQLVEYLAKAPKSNKSYVAYNSAKADVQKYGNLAVPMHFRNGTTKLMKDIGYGKGYEYDHDLDSKKSDQECFPEKLNGRDYY